MSSENKSAGWAYVISGGLTLGVSIPGYYLSTDAFARTVYIVGETLGVAAVGYGAYLLTVEDEYSRFSRMLKNVPSLSAPEQEALARQFLVENADRARSIRKIRIITHSLGAGLNLVNGVSTSNSELKTALLFLAGVNAAAAISLAVKKSEEEDLSETLGEQANREPTAELIVGPVMGLRLSF